MPSGKKWNKEEIDFLKDNWGEIPPKKIAEKLNRTNQAIRRKATDLGLGEWLYNTSEYELVKLFVKKIVILLFLLFLLFLFIKGFWGLYFYYFYCFNYFCEQIVSIKILTNL